MNKRKGVILISSIFFLCSIGYLFFLPLRVDYLMNQKNDSTIDYAIILGAKVKPGEIPSLALRYRIDSTCELYQKQPHLTFVASGGQGINEDATEASVIKQGLLQCGVKDEQILLEDQSVNTFENLTFSKQLMNTNRAYIITSDFHIARANMLATRIGINSTMIGAKTPKSVELYSWFREYAAYIKSFIMDR